jgi:DNA recombination protein RmuC
MELTIIITLSIALVTALTILATVIIKKNALEITLKTKEEYDARLEEKHETELAALRERREKDLAEQKEIRDRELAEQKELREKDLQNMKDAFKILSAENSSEFRRQSAESISELMKPVQEKFVELGKAVQESRKESVEQSAQLKEHIHNVMERSQAVSDEARNLANALTGYSKVQGDFGEMLLTNVLKNAGLVEGVHFVTQNVMTDNDGHEIKNEDGGTMIPDVMVFYPDDTTVIIDSKVSLNDYKKYISAETVEDRIRFAKAHAESVRRHVDELKAKDYASYLPEGRRKVNYNLMFIPIEGAFRLMLEEDAMLWQVAKDSNVLIVSQMTLIIVLNMIQMAWKQADQEKNIADVYKAAGELMGQLSGWMENYVTIGDSLDKAQAAYRKSTEKLTESNQSVVRKIQKLEKLGLTPRKSQARIKTGSRKTGPESIIPPQLSRKLPEE